MWCPPRPVTCTGKPKTLSSKARRYFPSPSWLRVTGQGPLAGAFPVFTGLLHRRFRSTGSDTDVAEAQPYAWQPRTHNSARRGVSYDRMILQGQPSHGINLCQTVQVMTATSDNADSASLCKGPFMFTNVTVARSVNPPAAGATHTHRVRALRELSKVACTAFDNMAGNETVEGTVLTHRLDDGTPIDIDIDVALRIRDLRNARTAQLAQLPTTTLTATVSLTAPPGTTCPVPVEVRFDHDRGNSVMAVGDVTPTLNVVTLVAKAVGLQPIDVPSGGITLKFDDGTRSPHLMLPPLSFLFSQAIESHNTYILDWGMGLAMLERGEVEPFVLGYLAAMFASDVVFDRQAALALLDRVAPKRVMES